MPPPSKSTKPSHNGSGKDLGDREATPSTTLWVGNLSSDVNDADLLDLFGKFGVLDATSYGTRSYGFVFFMRVEDAVAAKDTLQGANFKGISIKIEFARPAKACKDVWVGGISHSLSADEVEKEFLKFGKIEDFKFNRERNTAFIDYVRLEDAIQAMRTLNGKQLGGEQVRVDFVRLQPLKRENWHDAPDSRDRGRGMGPSDIHAGSKRQHPLQPSGVRDGQPSNILWVGYPPSLQIDEQMLHNAMILFGEIERISPYPSRHFAFVEFRSMDEARRAKEGLQGRLFNDPRITIMYSNSGGPAPGRGGEYPGFQGSVKGGAGPELFGNEHPFRAPPPQMDMFGHNMPPRRFGPRNTFDPVSGTEYDDELSGGSWRRPSPLHSAASAGSRAPGGWDVYDRDSKRARMDGSLDETSFPSRMKEDRLGLDRGFGARYGRGPGPDPDDDYLWRGVIAKGGTPVCHARCVPIGDGLVTELPEMVNCSARTGLDLLAKHYIDADGFNIVYFLPDSEDDFASYTEFLRYLGSKNRAGVAKFDDGTTLFLVPPSDFLRKVLKVVGPERLYGVVLKLPHPVPNNNTSMHHHPVTTLPHYSDSRQHLPPPNQQPDYSLVSPKEDHPTTDYGRILQGEPNKLPHKPPPYAPSSEPQGYVPNNTGGAASQPQPPSSVGLTPELIAALSKLVPAKTHGTPSAEGALQNLKSPGEQSFQQNYRPSMDGAQQNFRAPLAPSAPNTSQGWNYEPSSVQQQQQQQQGVGGGQFIMPPQMSSLPQFQPYSVMNSAATMHTSPSSPAVHHQMQDPNAAINNMLPTFSQGGQFGVPPPLPLTLQHQQHDGGGQGQRGGYGVPPPQGHDASGMYNNNNNNSHHHNISSSSSSTNHQGVGGFPQTQANLDLSNHQMQQQQQQQQQQQAEEGGDKNQRFQSTLQFAANLLFQIQQKQQQHPNAQPGRGGPGN